MERKRGTKHNVYYYRGLGREHNVTEGSEHYKGRGIEPIEYAIANDRFEDFAITNIIKYAERFKTTRNPDDLKKVVDYANILCGIELDKEIRSLAEEKLLQSKNHMVYEKLIKTEGDE